jgi:hypothetical protein
MRSKNLILALVIAVVAGGSWLVFNRQSSPVAENINQSAVTADTTFISISAVEGEDALTTLKNVHQVETKEFPGQGEYVTAINGRAAESNEFWAFYINGKSSEVGAGNYTGKAGDIYEFKIETF